MKNGFYFSQNRILSDYFLLQKIQLIEHFPIENKAAQTTHFNFNKSHSFCSVFDYNENSNYVVIFKGLSLTEIEYLKTKFKNNQTQKILIICHILYDYRKVLDQILYFIPLTKVQLLVDSDAHPYMASEKDILKLNMNNFMDTNLLVFSKKTKLEGNKSFFLSVSTVLNYMVIHMTIFALKPIQSTKDFYATYNFNFFYGQLRLLIIKIMYNFRHLATMFFIRIFYGLKLGFVIFYIKIKSILHRSMGLISWCYYRLEWLGYKTFELNMKYTFYPFRKLYWFFSFQYKKRILGNMNK